MRWTVGTPNIVKFITRSDPDFPLVSYCCVLDLMNLQPHYIAAYIRDMTQRIDSNYGYIVTVIKLLGYVILSKYHMEVCSDIAVLYAVRFIQPA